MTDTAPRSEPSFRYRHEGDYTLIEIKLTKIEQLFNSLDPSPFHEKDLDRAAEDYIVDSVRDQATDAPLKLVIYLPPEALVEPRIKATPDSIRNYFSYCLESSQRKRRLLLREGRLALALGLAFLIACIALRQIFFRHSSTMVGETVSEGLLILGWVAMWRPMEMLLYDWWPIRRLSNTYRRLSEIEVDLRPRDASSLRSGDGTRTGLTRS